MKRNATKKVSRALSRLKFRNRPQRQSYHRDLTVDPKANPTTIQYIAYGPDQFVHQREVTMDEALTAAGSAPVTWIDIAGLQDVAALQILGAKFNIHSLVMEDLVRPHQRPKLESYEHFLYMVLRMAPYGECRDLEQLSILILPGIVISVQEQTGDSFDLIRDRIRSGRGRIRGAQADYLAYALLDATIDAYFPLLEELGDQLTEVENAIMEPNAPQNLRVLFEVRHRLGGVRRVIWPLREVTSQLMRDDMSIIQPETRVFLRDCSDHAAQLLDYLEYSRELVASLMEFYISATGMRMNEIIKVMTIITVVFSPLTFVVGIYGMNFDTGYPLNMPELRSPYGYVAVCLAMVLLVVMQLIYFWKRGWIFRKQNNLG